MSFSKDYRISLEEQVDASIYELMKQFSLSCDENESLVIIAHRHIESHCNQHRFLEQYLERSRDNVI